jgi:hypothetical protein
LNENHPQSNLSDDLLAKIAGGPYYSNFDGKKITSMDFGNTAMHDINIFRMLQAISASASRAFG